MTEIRIERPGAHASLPHKGKDVFSKLSKFVVFQVTFKIMSRAIAMAPWLKVLAALIEDPSLVPSIHIRWLSTAYDSSSMGPDILFWTSWACIHTHIHINKNFKNCFKFITPYIDRLASNMLCNPDWPAKSRSSRLGLLSTWDDLCEVPLPVPLLSPEPSSGSHHHLMLLLKFPWLPSTLNSTGAKISFLLLPGC